MDSGKGQSAFFIALCPKIQKTMFIQIKRFTPKRVNQIIVSRLSSPKNKTQKKADRELANACKKQAKRIDLGLVSLEQINAERRAQGLPNFNPQNITSTN